MTTQSVEQQLINQLSTEIQDTINREINDIIQVELLVRTGYTKVSILPTTANIQWAISNSKHKFQYCTDSWAFESNRDAAWFILRWSV